MARIRTIKPDIWDSEKVGRRTVFERLTFIGLISLADDVGRGRADPAFLRARLHPYDDSVTSKMCGDALKKIASVGLCKLYENDGASYYILPGWNEHQRINRPTPSALPDHGMFSEDSVSPPCGKGKEGKGREGIKVVACTPVVQKSIGNDSKQDQDTQDLLDRLVEFSDDPGARAFYQKAVKALGAGLVEEAMGETKMRAPSNRAKYLSKLLTDWMESRV